LRYQDACGSDGEACSVDAVKRKVISEFFFAPSVVLPIVGGISAGLLSWASGGSSYLTGAALLGILGGVGWMLTRIIFKVEDITEQAMQAELDQRLREENERLDALARQLRSDRDHRTQDYLTLIRSFRSEIEDAAQQTGLKYRSAQIREKVSQVFEAVVEQLQQSYRLWELAEKLTGNSRDKILGDRELVLQEVETTIERLRSTVDQFDRLVKTENKVDLASMREELDATMRIAKRTEERMRELENPSAGHEAYVQE
jgi:paraquat-inducible protein B